MSLGTYAYVNAKLRAKLSKLISERQYKQLVQAVDLEAAYEILRQTEYRELFQEIATIRHIRRAETALVQRLIAAHREIAAQAKGGLRDFIEELMRKHEVDNLKVLLRVWGAHEEPDIILRETICNEIPVEAILKAGTIEEIIVLLEDTPYRRPLTEAREQYKSTGSLFYLEIALDKQLYAATWKAIQKLPAADKKIASKLIGIEIDALNVNWILRFKRYYNLGLANVTNLMIPHGYRIAEESVREAYPSEDQASLISALLGGGYKGLFPAEEQPHKEVETLHLLEGALRESYREQLRKTLGGYPFTIGTTIGYLRLKRIEVSNIVTILNAKALNLPQDKIERSVVYG